MPSSSILFLNVLIIAACGLVYELLAGTVASYVLGDSVTQFSLVIGVYLAALGVGAWLSRYISDNLAQRFIEVELCVALIGGWSAPLLFLSFAYLKLFHVALYCIVIAVGILVGLEVPLLMRILKDRLEFKEVVARVLTFDYLGALLASVLFPLVLVPKLGLVRSSLVFGLLNAAVGLWATYALQKLLPKGAFGLRVRAVGVMVLLGVGVFGAERLTSLAEDNLYADEILYTKNTAYQRIVVTRGRAGFQLFLNGHLQFSSADEYRYHEALVHPAMLSLAAPRRVLVLGGGDGLAVRELLKYPSVEEIVLVDLDPDMTRLSSRFPLLAQLNGNSLTNPRVKIVNQDAMVWLDTSGDPFDAAIVDFPDPSNYSLGKLYTTRFYRLLKRHLVANARVAVQSTSPLFARSSYWCVVRTMEAAGYSVRPYHAMVPSFGEWGFALAKPSTSADESLELPIHVAGPNGKLRSLDDQALAALFVLGPDMQSVPVDVNRLDNQALVRYYESEWRRWE
jgi:spermidine synthase